MVLVKRMMRIHFRNDVIISRWLGYVAGGNEKMLP